MLGQKCLQTPLKFEEEELLVVSTCKAVIPRTLQNDTAETWSWSGFPDVIAWLNHPGPRAPCLWFQCPIPQTGELRPKGEKLLSQGHTASR